MKKFVLAIVLLVMAQSCHAADIPKPTGWVDDYANVISQEYRDKITRLIEELRQKTSAEIFMRTPT